MFEILVSSKLLVCHLERVTQRGFSSIVYNIGMTVAVFQFLGNTSDNLCDVFSTLHGTQQTIMPGYY